MKTFNRTQNLLNEIEQIDDTRLIQIATCSLSNVKVWALGSSLKTLLKIVRMNSDDVKLVHSKIRTIAKYEQVIGASYDIFIGNNSKLNHLAEIIYDIEVDGVTGEPPEPLKTHEIEIVSKNIAAEIRERFIRKFINGLKDHQSHINYYSFPEFLLYRVLEFSTVIIAVISIILSILLSSYLETRFESVFLVFIIGYLLFWVLIPSIYYFINSVKLTVFTDSIGVEYGLWSGDKSRGSHYVMRPELSDILAKQLNATTLTDFEWLDEILDRYCTTSEQRLALKISRLKAKKLGIDYYIKIIDEFKVALEK